MWNNPNDPMPIKIANGKTLQECIYYQGGGITVYTDNSVTVKSYPGFYDYYLVNERKMSEVMMLPVEGEEIVKDEEYYKKLINSLATDYNKQVENAPNLYKNTMVLQDVNTPAPIDFACTVFVDKIWVGGGYSVGTADRPPCPVNVPSGKLAFVTNATSDTHSFVMKGVSGRVKPTGNIRFYQTHISSTIGFERSFITGIDHVQDDIIQNNNVLISSKYSYLLGRNLDISIANKGISGGNFTLSPLHGTENCNSFTQLLIYKANLTETELKSENSKDIKLATNNTQMHTQI